jgi:hypothetical protein
MAGRREDGREVASQLSTESWWVARGGWRKGGVREMAHNSKEALLVRVGVSRGGVLRTRWQKRKGGREVANQRFNVRNVQLSTESWWVAREERRSHARLSFKRAAAIREIFQFIILMTSGYFSMILGALSQGFHVGYVIAVTFVTDTCKRPEVAVGIYSINFPENGDIRPIPENIR